MPAFELVIPARLHRDDDRAIHVSQGRSSRDYTGRDNACMKVSRAARRRGGGRAPRPDRGLFVGRRAQRRGGRFGYFRLPPNPHYDGAFMFFASHSTTRRTATAEDGRVDYPARRREPQLPFFRADVHAREPRPRRQLHHASID